MLAGVQLTCGDCESDHHHAGLPLRSLDVHFMATSRGSVEKYGCCSSFRGLVGIIYYFRYFLPLDKGTFCHSHLRCNSHLI